MVLSEIVEQVKQVKAWEEYVSIGLEAREQTDNGAWLLGDLARGIETDYGEDSIGKYSYAIGVAKKTMMGYRTVSGRFPVEVREKYKKLSYSHFKTTAALDKPEAWLEKADDNDWGVEKLTAEIKNAYLPIDSPEISDEPPKVVRCPECGQWRLEGLSSYEVCRGHYVLEGEKFKYK